MLHEGNAWYNRDSRFADSSDGDAVKTQTVRIVDLGRGPQIEGHWLTVMDVFYYLHRGYDFDFIHRAMPSLLREEFDAVVEYVNQHRDELVEKDRRASGKSGSFGWRSKRRRTVVRHRRAR